MKISSKLLILVSVGFLGASAQAGKYDGQCYPDRFPGSSATGEVVRTVDGDTAKVRVQGQEYNVRFLGIDTPETHYQGASQGYWGEVAAERLAELLPVGQSVTLEFDGQKCDRYRRILAHVYVNGQSVNRQMLRESLAVNYCIFPNVNHCGEYATEVAQSRQRGQGMWSDSSLMLPYEWRKAHDDLPWDKNVGDSRT